MIRGRGYEGHGGVGEVEGRASERGLVARWCDRGGEEVRWGCPARGHGAVATQTRGCSQCLYQRLPKIS